MSNIISSAIFCVRNVDKAENQGKEGRWAVADTKMLIAGGQGKKVFDYVSKLDKTIVGKGAQSAAQFCQKAAKSEKLFDYAGRAVDFASKNVNFLICASAGIDVLTSDDKEAALVTNGTALTSMFAVEHLMKKHLDEIPKMDCMKGIAEKVIKFEKENKCEGKISAIIHGVAFVVGSCAAYSVGDKFGHLLIGQSLNGKQ